MSHRFLLGITLIFAVLFVVFGHMSWPIKNNPMSYLSTEARVRGSFTLTDHTGRIVTERDFLGYPLLIYFGFTSCPDVCPITLKNIARALDIAGKVGEQVRPVFVTVDPEHDTPTIIAKYVHGIHPRLIGLTGAPEQIQLMVKTYKVYTSSDDHQIQHSDYIFFIGSDGDLIEVLPGKTDPKIIAQKVKDLFFLDTKNGGS